MSAALLATLASAPAAAEDFTYNPPGQLVAGSGQGSTDDTVYVPGMRFPIEAAPAYPNSQVWGHGGYQGPGGGQCNSNNYSYPWWDNFCETRSWDVPMCPGGTGHQGQDIRPSTCDDNVHWCVAAQDGEITNVGSYSVYLVADDGTRHRYLHMDPGSVTVSVGDRVTKGDQLGRVSNAFGGTPTTIHLHYDIFQTVSGVGPSYVPLYMSLVRSYERLLGIPQEPCATLGPEGGAIDDDGPCFRLQGNVSSWRRAEAGQQGQLRWTYAYDGDAPDAWASWQVDLTEGGDYLVEVWLEEAFAQSERARYEVVHAGQTSPVRLDMTTGAGWRELGEFTFAAGADQSVILFDDTGEPLSAQRRIMADAIRLTPVTEPPVDPPDMGPSPDPPDMGAPAPQPDMRQPDPEPDPAPQPDMRASAPDPDPPVDEDPGDGASNPGGGGAGGGVSETESSSCAAAAPVGAPAGAPALLLGALGLWGWRRRRRGRRRS